MQQPRKGRSWCSEPWRTYGFNQVCGYTPQTVTKRTGMQAPVAPTTTGNRIIRQSARSADESLIAGDTFSIDLIDKAKEQAIAKQLDANGNPTIPRIRPVMIGGSEKYVMYLHDWQVTDMRVNTGSGQWLDITKAAMTGGEVTKNPIYSGALGEYNGVVLRRSPDITQGVNSSTGAAVTTARRAVLLGAQAAMMAFGQRNSPGKIRWSEELNDSSVAVRAANDNCVNSGDLLAA
jgi:N4-gp56 family major capsid protein